MNKLNLFKQELAKNPQGEDKERLIHNIEEFLKSTKTHGRLDELCSFQLELASIRAIAHSYLIILDPTNPHCVPSYKQKSTIDQYSNVLFNKAYYGY